MDNTLNNLTVGIPTFNSERTIERCIKSVVLQEFVPSMIIISDDGSTDSTTEICKELLEAASIDYKIINNSGPSGISGNYNSIVKNCKTEYLQILDHDDYLLHGTFTVDFQKVLQTFSGLILLRMSLEKSLLNGLIKPMQLALSILYKEIPRGLPLLGTTFTRSGIIYPLNVLRKFPLQSPYQAGADILQFHQMRGLVKLRIWNFGGIIYSLNSSAYSSSHSVSLYPKTFLYGLDFLLRRNLSRKIRKVII